LALTFNTSFQCAGDRGAGGIIPGGATLYFGKFYNMLWLFFCVYVRHSFYLLTNRYSSLQMSNSLAFY